MDTPSLPRRDTPRQIGPRLTPFLTKMSYLGGCLFRGVSAGMLVDRMLCSQNVFLLPFCCVRWGGLPRDARLRDDDELRSAAGGVCDGHGCAPRATVHNHLPRHSTLQNSQGLGWAISNLPYGPEQARFALWSLRLVVLQLHTCKKLTMLRCGPFLSNSSIFLKSNTGLPHGIARRATNFKDVCVGLRMARGLSLRFSSQPTSS